MATYTPNYNLVKIDLNDAPPDITVINQNWDTLDEKMKEAIEGGASEIVFTATIPTDGWSDSAPYHIDIGVNGMSVDYYPTTDVIDSDDAETRALEREAWPLISKIDTSDNTITVWCDEDIPAQALNIKMKVVV